MAPLGAPFGVLSRCMRLSGKAAPLPKRDVSASAGADRRRARIRPVTDLRWRLAGGPGRSRRMVPSGLILAGRRAGIIHDPETHPAVFSPGGFFKLPGACLCASKARPR